MNSRRMKGINNRITKIDEKMMKKAIQFSKSRLRCSLPYLSVLLFVQTTAFARAFQHEETIQLPVETVVDKIRGGMLGQILGNLNGLPHEFAYIKEPGQVKNYVPELLAGAHTDDDTDFEWVYIVEMQKERNIYLPYDEIYALWIERINRRIWCEDYCVKNTHKKAIRLGIRMVVS